WPEGRDPTGFSRLPPEEPANSDAAERGPSDLAWAEPDERAAPGLAPAVDGAHPGLDDMEPEFAIEGPRPGAWARTREALPMGEALRVFALALVMFLAFRAVGHTYVVSGASMEPTFHDAEMVVVNRLAYRGFDLSWLP